MGLVKFLGLDKAANLYRVIKLHGGIGASLKQMYLTDDLKDGKLVGIDQFGNRYWENNAYTYPRNRWVDFNRKRFLDYDASQIPPEWHRWLVQATDKAPTVDLPEQHRWLMPHKENLSGQTLDRENELYMPYSTTRPKVTGWTGPKSK